MTGNRMRLLLADDHDLVREALELLLRRWDQTIQIFHAASLHQALRSADENPDLDLILLDVRMPGMNRLAGLQVMRQRHPTVPVALITGFEASEIAATAIEAGAAGVIPKAISGKGLVAAIQLILSGERYIPDPRLLEHRGANSDGQLDGDVPDADMDKLTERERGVLMLLTSGVSNKEIARDLEIEVVTVAVHLSRIYRKLGVVNRTQAVRKAMELGMALDPDPGTSAK
jgi:two-component system nitrate/nitrite response regulator NarL